MRAFKRKHRPPGIIGLIAALMLLALFIVPTVFDMARPAYAKAVFIKTGYTGGGADNLDGIDGDTGGPRGTALADGDFAFVLVSGTSEVTFHVLDATSGVTESSPDVISPDSNAGNKRWILHEIDGAMYDLSDDTSPKLGGDLDGNSKNISGVSEVETQFITAKTGTNLIIRDNAGAEAERITTTDIVVNEGGLDRDWRLEGTGTANLLKCDAGINTVAFGTSPISYTRIYSQASDAQSTIYVGVKAHAASDAANNYGSNNSASGGGGTNNIGCFASAANATNNYPFKDAHGNYSAAGGWVDVSDPDRKTLIRIIDQTEIEQQYALLDSIIVKGYRYKAEIPIIGYEKELAQSKGLNGELLFNTEPGEPIYNEIGEIVGHKPDKQTPVMVKVPIRDVPEAAPQRYGMMADEMPDFMASKDKKGIAAGRVAAYLMTIVQKQKQLIEALDNRVKLLEAASP